MPFVTLVSYADAVAGKHSSHSSGGAGLRLADPGHCPGVGGEAGAYALDRVQVSYRWRQGGGSA